MLMSEDLPIFPKGLFLFVPQVLYDFLCKGNSVNYFNMLGSPTQSTQTLATCCSYNFLGNIMWIRIGEAIHGNKCIFF